MFEITRREYTRYKLGTREVLMTKLAARFNGPLKPLRPAIETGVSMAGRKWKMLLAMRNSPRFAAAAARVFRL